MRAFLIVGVLMVCPVFGAAQTLVMRGDRVAYPELGSEVPQKLNLDGDDTTTEFVQQRFLRDAFEVRGLALRDGRLCLGPWFRPFDVAAAHLVPGDGLLFGMIWITGGIERYTVVGWRGYYDIAISYGCDDHRGVSK